MTCVRVFFGNYRITLSETTQNYVEKQKSNLIKRKDMHMEKNDKVIANKQPNLRKRDDSKRAELSNLPKHANLYFF